MAATQFAADTPLLVTGLVATAGIFSTWRLLIYGIAFLLMAYVFSPLWRRARVLTDAELTEIRYSGRGVLPLRVLKAVYYGTVINCVVLAMVLVAAVRIAEVFLPWHEWLPGAIYLPLQNAIQAIGITLTSASSGLDPAVATTNNLLSVVLILAFTALYSTTGGLRSVVTTDIMQFSLAMVGTIAYAVIVIRAVGGFGGLGERYAVIVIRAVGGFGGLGERLTTLYGGETVDRLLSFTPSAQDALIPFLVVVGLQWLFQMNSDGTGYLAQRSMGCATDRDARIAGVTFAWLQILLRSLPWLIIAVGLLALYPLPSGAEGREALAGAREILFVTGIDDLLPIGIRGVMLTGLLAALASTIDTHLNWGASYWSNDIYKRLVAHQWMRREPGNRELVLVARCSNVLIILIALTIMANLGSIQTAWFISLLFGAGMGAVLVLRWVWERINLYSELMAIAVSLVVAPILLVTTDQEWIRLAVMAAVSTAAAVIVTWFTPATEAGTRQSFYERVRPPGFWTNTARELGEPRGAPLMKLRRGLASTALTGVSLYLLLYGVGTLLLPAARPSALWSVLAIIGGIALVPVWRKRL
jgi:Na+/proline symporter